jgi:hypothetical protein
MLFNQSCTRIRTHFGSVALVTLVWSHCPIRCEWQAIAPSYPAVMVVLYHAMEVSCYHFFWAVKLQLCLHLVTLGSVTFDCVQMPQGIQFKCKVCQIFLHRLLSQPFKVAEKSSGLSSKHPRAIYLVLKTASRDAEEIIKVSSYIFSGFH